MHRALFLPEILIAILSLLSRQDNARCARVCKLWSDAALDEVWREIDSILNLFRIVGLKPGLMDLTLESPPGPSQWARLLKVSRRVRGLDLHLEIYFRQSLSDLIKTMDPPCQISTIFPRLHRMTAVLEDVALPLFINPSVTALYLTIWSSDETIKDLSLQAPYLNVLHFTESQADPLSIQTLLSQSLTVFPSLIEFYVPSDSLLPSLVEIASLLPNLRMLGQSPPENVYYNRSQFPGRFAPDLKVGSFPSLREPSFTATLSDATALIRHPHFPSHNLDCLRLYAIFPLRDRDFIHFSTAAADLCPNIKELAIFVDDSSPHPRLHVQFFELAPLLHLRKLAHLNIHYLHPIHMSDQDVKDLASDLPYLERLHITAAEPSAVHPRTLPSLSTLTQFARHFPLLRDLALSLDLTNNDVDALSGVPLLFRSLERLKLHLGFAITSSDEAEPVASFITGMLHDDCIFYTTSIVVDDSAGPWSASISGKCRYIEELVRRMLESRRHWEKVEKRMKTEMQRVRKENERFLQRL